MAMSIKFQCNEDYQDYITVEQDGCMVTFLGECEGQPIQLLFDIPTAIKLSKTIRTEINKAKEVNNG